MKAFDLKVKNTKSNILAEQVKQRKLKAIGTRTQLQAIERQNMSKKVSVKDLRVTQN